MVSSFAWPRWDWMPRECMDKEELLEIRLSDLILPDVWVAD